MKQSTARTTWIKRTLGIVAVLIVGVLLLYDLDGYPRIWFDEGIHMLGARRLARTGAYRAGPAVGPTVVYPVAGAFTLLGEGIWQVRLIVVSYAVLALALGYALIQHIGSRAVALITLGLWLASPGLNFLGWSRQMLGEVPALAFLLGGILFWSRSLSGTRSYSWAGLGGVCLGLAVLTKNHFVFVVPAFVLIWLADRIYYRRTRWGPMALTLGLTVLVPIVWYALLPLVAGVGVARHTVEQWETAPARSMWIGDLGLMFRSARFIAGPRALLGLAVPGLLFAWPWVRRRSARGLVSGLLWVFAVIWLGWYVLISIGWERYAFAGLALLAPFAARLLVDLWQRVRFSLRLRSIAAASMALLLGIPLLMRGVDVVNQGDHTAQQMAAYLSARVPVEAVIETWEPEIAFLTEHQYHFPSAAILDGFSRTKALGEPPPAYDPLDANPDYILVGAFGWWTELYSQEFLSACCREVETIGTYALFEVTSGAGASSQTSE